MTKPLQVQDFWTRVQVDAPDKCWIWQGSIKSTGYGQLMVNYKNISVHRYAYELANGPIPSGMFVCHSCDNRRCVNPAHLWLGTAADNYNDMVAKGRKGETPRERRAELARARFGERSYVAKLKRTDVIEIRRRVTNGESQRAVASDFHIDQSTVSSIIRGLTWRNE